MEWFGIFPHAKLPAMMNKRIPWFVLGVAFLSVLLIGGPIMAQAMAGVREVNEPPQGARPVFAAEPQALKATSQQWHTYLWEALPAEWLQDAAKAPLMQAYQENDWKPFFITGRFEIDPNGRLLLQRLETLQQDAIDPRPYRMEDLKTRVDALEALRFSLEASDPAYRDALADGPEPVSPPKQTPEGSASDIRRTTEANRMPVPGADQARVKDKIYQDLFRAAVAVDLQLAGNLLRFTNEMNPFVKELQVKALLGQSSMNEFLKELEPPAAQYQVLLQALKHYQQLAVRHPQPRLVPSQKLGLGDGGNAVRDLQQRLQEEDFYQGKITGHFDETTRQAVQQFQLFHNLDADGKVGQQTREWLNVSFQAKADLIARALKLHRQSQTRRFQKFVWVNIPQFTLEYRKEGKIEAVHRVIVGKAGGKRIKLNGRMMGENQTPTLASNIEQVVFNPRWIVTDRIRLELSDAIAADPTFLSRNGYVEMTSSRDPSGVSRLIQLPGPNNALGRVRFDFPNVYAVYMHDTPNRGLFQRSRRDFSHGCIRVDKAHELARELLAADQNPAAFKTEAFLGTNRETFLKLNEPVPIVIEYLPVVVNARGELVFCGDPYGWFQDNSDRKS